MHPVHLSNSLIHTQASTPIPSSLQKHQQSLLRRYQQHSAQRRSYSNPLGLPPPPQGILVSPSPSGNRDRDPAVAAARGGANDDAESYTYVMQGLGTSTPTPKKHATGTVSFSAVKSVYSSSGVEVSARAMDSLRYLDITFLRVFALPALQQTLNHPSHTCTSHPPGGRPALWPRHALAHPHSHAPRRLLPQHTPLPSAQC